MDSAQANALLVLIADLARIIYAPPPEPADASANGQAAAKEQVAAR